ncbi:MAG: hypothetical protein OHK0053_12620 [Microscillaceae bacterium]
MLSIIFGLLLAACGGGEKAQTADSTATDTATEASNEEAPEEAPQEEVFSVKGQVVSLPEAGKKDLTVDHEEIPDFMKAMRMSLTLADSTEAKDLAVGDKISFEMVKGESGFLMRKIEKLPADTELELAAMPEE